MTSQYENSINGLQNILRGLVKNVREYGLAKCSLPMMVKKTAMLLRPLSLNVDPYYNNKIPLLCNIFTIVICFCYFYVYVLSMVWFVFFKCIETGEVIDAMLVFALGIASEITTVKVMCVRIFQDTLRKLIEKYLIHNSKCESNDRFTKNLLKVLRRVKKRAMIFWFVIIGNGTVYALKPLLMPGRHVMEDVEFLFGLEPLLESPNYEIAYFLSLGGVIFTCYGTANISGFFIMSIGYIEAQMLSLSHEVTNIWEDAKDHYYQNHVGTGKCFENNENKDIIKEKNIILNEYVKKQLQKVVDYHTTNMGFLYQIEGVFRTAIAVEFGLLIVSLIAELLGGLENTYLLLPYALVQVSMDCLTGQKLLDASNEFLKAVYDCHWENFDVKNMKTVLMILRISQKGMTVSAGGLMALNFVSLMSVFRLIYSTYTALRSSISD